MIIDRIPRGSRPRFPVVTFESDVLLLGQYQFNNAANTDVVVLENISPSCVYVIDSLTVFGNMAEDAYLEGQLTAVNIPRFHLHLLRSASSAIYAEPYRMGNYIDGLQQLVYFRAQARGGQAVDTLLATCFGLVDQSPGLVGFPTIQLQISFVIYEITDQAWVEAFEAENSGKFQGLQK